MKDDEWFNSQSKEWRTWTYSQGQNIRNRQHPLKLSARTWEHQQKEIDKLKLEIERLKASKGA